MGVRARAVAHGKLITLGCNPNLMDRIFDSDVLETLFFAKTYALGVGGRKTAELDVMHALLPDKLVSLLQPNQAPEQGVQNAGVPSP